MNKNKVIGWIIGIVGGYLISHYVISPKIFGHQSNPQDELIQSIDESLYQQRRQLPLKIDPYTTLTAVDRRDLNIAFTYEVDMQFIQANPHHLQQQQFKQHLCQGVQEYFKCDIRFDFIYKDEKGHVIDSIPINEMTCST